jgi:hypothetical protein
MIKYLAVCTKCESIKEVNERTREAWCYHTTKVNGEDLHVETVTCRIVKKEVLNNGIK